MVWEEIGTHNMLPSAPCHQLMPTYVDFWIKSCFLPKALPHKSWRCFSLWQCNFLNPLQVTRYITEAASTSVYPQKTWERHVFLTAQREHDVYIKQADALCTAESFVSLKSTGVKDGRTWHFIFAKCFLDPWTLLLYVQSTVFRIQKIKPNEG